MKPTFQQMNESTFNVTYKSDDTHSSPKRPIKDSLAAKKKKLHDRLYQIEEDRIIKEAGE